MSELSYQQTLLCELIEALKKIPPFKQYSPAIDNNEFEEPATEEGIDPLISDADAEEFITELTNLSITKPDDAEEFYLLGQHLLCKLVMHYPHATHLANRDLFWFFAGDCLHYLSDEEISAYQIMDELRFPADPHKHTPMEREEARIQAFKSALISN